MLGTPLPYGRIEATLWVDLTLEARKKCTPRFRGGLTSIIATVKYRRADFTPQGHDVRIKQTGLRDRRRGYSSQFDTLPLAIRWERPIPVKGAFVRVASI